MITLVFKGLSETDWNTRPPVGGGGGGGPSLIWPLRECAAEQGMVFRVLSLEQGT